MPKVTIIVPDHDADVPLTRCLESLFMQTEPDFEVIICTHQGSTNTISTVTDPRVEYLPSIEGDVMAVTVNRALKKAKSDYILFVNTTDMLCIDLIETVLPWAQLTDNDLILFGHITHNRNEEVYLPSLRISDDKESIFRCFLLEHKGIGIQKWQYLFKKDFLVKKNIWFDESLIHFNDFLFIARALFYCNGLSSISKPLYHHYKISHVNEFQQRTEDRFLAIESLRQFLIKANAYGKYKDEFTLLLLRFGYILSTYEYLNLSHRHINAQNKQYIRKILKKDEFKNIEINNLQLPKDQNRSKNTLSYKELQRLKTTICERFALLEISYKITLRLLRYRHKPLWKNLPAFMRNPLLIL